MMLKPLHMPSQFATPSTENAAMLVNSLEQTAQDQKYISHVKNKKWSFSPTSNGYGLETHKPHSTNKI